MSWRLVSATASNEEGGGAPTLEALIRGLGEAAQLGHLHEERDLGPAIHVDASPRSSGKEGAGRAVRVRLRADFDPAASARGAGPVARLARALQGQDRA